MCDRRRDLQIIAREVSINFGLVRAILTDVYGISKVSARWVPRQLTDDQKRIRFDISRYLLSHYKDKLDFIYRIVTQGDIWVHSGSTLAHQVRREEIKEGAYSREADGFNILG
jgi:histone-lysine N-methyltransferase SETMAR